ncbi:MAG: hypothetical protein WC768_05330 [Patescibacteria group bacterium]|jgi:hypothetical protein
MKERTVSQRNFLGAFLGGVLGILTLGYVHVIVLPLGCFLGAVVGWWYQEIWQSVIASCHRGVASRRAWDQSKTGVRIIVLALVWLARRPTALIRWWRAHPMNRAYTIRTLVALTHLALNFTLFYCGKAVVSILYTDDDVGMSVLVFLLITIPVLFAQFAYLEDKTPAMRKFYLIFESYTARGPLRFFARDLAFLFLFEMVASVVLAWFAVIGGLFLIFVIVPTAAVVGAVKGIYQVSMRAGHWLCFGTTVVVTALTAWIVSPYLNDARILWIVALFAGLASAIVTEGFYRLLAHSERAQTIITATLKYQLASRCHAFMRITTIFGTIVSDRFRGAFEILA